MRLPRSDQILRTGFIAWRRGLWPGLFPGACIREQADIGTCQWWFSEEKARSWQKTALIDQLRDAIALLRCLVSASCREWPGRSSSPSGDVKTGGALMIN